MKVGRGKSSLYGAETQRAIIKLFPGKVPGQPHPINPGLLRQDGCQPFLDSMGNRRGTLPADLKAGQEEEVPGGTWRRGAGCRSSCLMPLKPTVGCKYNNRRLQSYEGHSSNSGPFLAPTFFFHLPSLVE